MAIVDRITRLFSADVHAVLDRIEEPEALLRQAIREMEGALAARGQQLRALEVEAEALARRRAEVERVLAAVREEIELCFAAGDDALLRRSLRRRLEGERMQRVLEQRATALARQHEEARSLHAQQAERLEGMRQKAALFEVETAPDAAPWAPEEAAVSEADVELALLRERQARRAAP